MMDGPHLRKVRRFASEEVTDADRQRLVDELLVVAARISSAAHAIRHGNARAFGDLCDNQEVLGLLWKMQQAREIATRVVKQAAADDAARN